MTASPTHITELGPNEVFVFGSNLAGRHGRGAALYAKRHFGAIQGSGVGWHGQSYAIPTKDSKLVTLPLSEIRRSVFSFLVTAGFSLRSDVPSIFLVTEIGCGLAGYTPEQIAPLFKGQDGQYPPPNVHLPASFIKILESVD